MFAAWERALEKIRQLNEANDLSRLYVVCQRCRRTKIGTDWRDDLCPLHHVKLEETRSAAGINIVCRPCTFNIPVTLNNTSHGICPDCLIKEKS